MKKRILFRISSMDRSCHAEDLINIIKNIDEEKFEPLIFMDYHEGDLIKDIPHDISVTYLVKGRNEMSKISLLLFFELINRRLQILFYHFFPSYVKKKIRNVPDIEVAFDISSLSGLIKSPFRYSKKVSWLHEYIRGNYTLNYSKKLAKMMCRCRITVFNSLQIKEVFESHLGVKIPHSICIHPYINDKSVMKKSLQYIPEIRQLFKGQDKIFVSAGSLTHHKGYDALIASHAELLQEGFIHKVVVIGDGNEYNMLKNMIEYMGVSDSFFLLNGENPYPYIRSGDYYIQPSRYEPYPVILGEVMVLHKPIISTDTGGTGELLGNWGSAYIIQFDPREIKESMKKFLCDESFVASIVQEQKGFDFQKYNKTICDQLTDLFSTI